MNATQPTLGKTLAALRKQKGFTQEALALRINSRRQVIQRIEGNPDLASLGMLRKIAGVLDEPLSKMLRFSEHRDAA